MTRVLTWPPRRGPEGAEFTVKGAFDLPAGQGLNQRTAPECETTMVGSINLEDEDHLEPEDSAFSDGEDRSYERMLIAKFIGAFARDVYARAIVLPSFDPEYVVGIRGTPAGHYRAFCISPDMQLWNYE